MTKYSSFRKTRMGPQSDSLDRESVLAVKNTVNCMKRYYSDFITKNLHFIHFAKHNLSSAKILYRFRSKFLALAFALLKM